jgi:BirA family biotin operon repressor/biotin-[acetyl-CoA-carboxylase] ligase
MLSSSDLIVKSEQIFDLNVIVSLSVFQVLKTYNISNLRIKWPNDIMSDSKKIGGILIENIFKTDNTIVSIVGIGLNVNQTDFSTLPKASSIKNSIGISMDIDLLANDIRNKLYQNMANRKINSSLFWKMYEENLFKLNIPMAFEDAEKNRFMAIIKGVSSNGKLQLLLEDDSTNEYDIKEIQMLY